VNSRVPLERHHQHELAQRHVRQHRVDQVRGRLSGASSGAARTEAAALAGERDEVLLLARVAPNPNEALGEQPAIQEAAERAGDEGRGLLLLQKRSKVLAHRHVER
jgi:hypothetical protein